MLSLLRERQFILVLSHEGGFLLILTCFHLIFTDYRNHPGRTLRTHAHSRTTPCEGRDLPHTPSAAPTGSSDGRNFSMSHYATTVSTRPATVESLRMHPTFRKTRETNLLQPPKTGDTKREFVTFSGRRNEMRQTGVAMTWHQLFRWRSFSLSLRYDSFLSKICDLLADSEFTAV